jgi:hypothetical protein
MPRVIWRGRIQRLLHQVQNKINSRMRNKLNIKYGINNLEHPKKDQDKRDYSHKWDYHKQQILKKTK